MQLIPIVLVAAVVLAADGGPFGDALLGSVDPLGSTLLAIGPVIAILLVSLVIIHRCLGRLGRGGSARSAMAAERWTRIARWLIVGNHAVVLLLFGWLETVRSWTGDVVLVDELVAMLPALLGLAGTWWIYYPLEKRLREALLVRQLDQGATIYAIPPRWRFVLLQFQVHILLMLAPILMILAAGELIEIAAERLPAGVTATFVIEGGTLVAALSIFLLAPLMARFVLSVAPLPPGPLRDQLLEICDRHDVEVRQILVWRTSGTMINAAVMGIFRPVRYVLLTDALLDMVPRPFVTAVMAHEIGHVRRRHLPWLVVSVMATIVIAILLISAPMTLLTSVGLLADEQWLEFGAISVVLVLALLAFGWISRRFERQADTFAVQHLSGLGGDGVADGEQRIGAGAVATMRGALESIALLNSVDPDRISWRHGSIAWRRDYLLQLVGLPVARPPIDRVIGRIKIASLTALLAGGATIAAWTWWSSPPVEARGPIDQASMRPVPFEVPHAGVTSR